MEQIQEYIDKFKKGLPELFDLVLDDCTKQIHFDLDAEYDIPESQYAESHPIVQLKPNIYELTSGLEFSDYKNNVLLEFTKYANKIKPLFSQFIQLQTNEIVIHVYIKKIVYRCNNYDGCCNTFEHRNEYSFHRKIFTITITYITNYGRIISNTRENIRFNGICRNGYSGYCPPEGYDIDTNIVFDEGQYYYLSNYTHPYPQTRTLIPIEPTIPLTYKFPKLFLDIINAYKMASTDAMQKCCEHYYSRIYRLNKLENDNANLIKAYDSIKTRNTTLEIKNAELNARIQVLDVDFSKDKILEKEQYIQELLMEITLLKIKNDEQRKLYMK